MIEDPIEATSASTAAQDAGCAEQCVGRLENTERRNQHTHIRPSGENVRTTHLPEGLVCPSRRGIHPVVRKKSPCWISGSSSSAGRTAYALRRTPQREIQKRTPSRATHGSRRGCFHLRRLEKRVTRLRTVGRRRHHDRTAPSDRDS